MEMLETTKTQIAAQLRAFSTSAEFNYAIAAIEGLGELGGIVAVGHLEELMEVAADAIGESEKAKWAALLRAYGRAGRLLPK